MIDESGIVEELTLISRMYRARLLDTARVGGLPRETGEALATIGARVMDAARLLDDLEIEMNGALSSDQVAVMRDFYRSVLGTRIRRVEARAFTVPHRADVQSRRAELQIELNRDPVRKRQLQDIDRYRLMSELSAAVDASLIYAVSVGELAEGEDGVSKDTLDALASGVTAMHDPLLRRARENVGTILFRTYRRLSDKDLEVYVAFLETDEGREAYAALFAAAQRVFQARQREMAESILTSVVRSKN